MNIQEAIKENTVIHCETESEAKRILNMAHELGYKWWTGRSFTDEQNIWEANEEATCYYIIDGLYGGIKRFNDANYTIINSTDITDMKTTTDMKQELTITPPSGYEIDEEKSTFQKIVFREIEKKFPTKLEEIDRPCYIDGHGVILYMGDRCDQTPNHFTSEESAEQALKFIKLLAFRDAIWEIEGKPENEKIDISFNFKTNEGLEHFEKMRKEIERMKEIERVNEKYKHK